MKTTTPLGDLSKLYGSSVTSGTITPPVITTIMPSGDGIFAIGNIGDDGGFNYVKALFTGTNAANETATARITLWHKCVDVWVPTVILKLDLILGTATGVDGKTIDDSDLIVDTIAVTSGGDYTDAYEIVSPGDNTAAFIKFDACGAAFVQVQLAKGTCDSVNVLAAGF